jgi:hypothetical protein
MAGRREPEAVILQEDQASLQQRVSQMSKSFCFFFQKEALSCYYVV